jgi:hypothetical protein
VYLFFDFHSVNLSSLSASDRLSRRQLRGSDGAYGVSPARGLQRRKHHSGFQSGKNSEPEDLAAPATRFVSWFLLSFVTASLAYLVSWQHYSPLMSASHVLACSGTTATGFWSIRVTCAWPSIKSPSRTLGILSVLFGSLTVVLPKGHADSGASSWRPGRMIAFNPCQFALLFIH